MGFKLIGKNCFYIVLHYIVEWFCAKLTAMTLEHCEWMLVCCQGVLGGC